MVIIFNKKIENKKSFTTNLVSYYGLNLYSIKQIKKTLGICGGTPILFLVTKKKFFLLNIIKNLAPLILNKLSFFIWTNKKRLVFINCYKGNRHLLKLPVKGQRTKTNAKSSKC